MKLTPEIEQFIARLRPTDIVIECGAHAGWGTEKLAASGATVYTFEPNSELFQLLKNKFVHRPNVICINKGVWHQNGRGRLFIYPPLGHDPYSHGYASTIIDKSLIVDPNHYVEIDLIDLTVFIQSMNRRITLLKMDIEGAEFELLDKIIGMNLHTIIDKIIVETHEWLIPDFVHKADHIHKAIQERQITNIELVSL